MKKSHEGNQQRFLTPPAISVPPSNLPLASNHNLRQRIITAAVGLPVVVILLLRGHTWMVGLSLSLLLVKTTFELARLTLHSESRRFYVIAVVTINVTAFIGISLGKMQTLRVVYGAILLVIVVGAFGPGTVQQRVARSEGMLFSLVYPLVTWFCTWDLWLHSRILPLYVLGISWGSDTVAFFGGKRFGRHKLSPAISPGKTWEGALWGFVGGVLMAAIIKYIAKDSLMGWSQIAAISPFAAICAQAGDALKSMHKRVAGVKDTGACLPGHGGIIDRVDSVLMVSAFLWLILPFLA